MHISYKVEHFSLWEMKFVSVVSLIYILIYTYANYQNSNLYLLFVFAD